MRKQDAIRTLGLALALPAAFALAAGPAQAQEEEEQTEQEEQIQAQEEDRCQVTFAPELIQAKADEVTVKAEFSEEIGTTTEVTPEEGSGLVVQKVSKAEPRVTMAAEEEEIEEIEKAEKQGEEEEITPAAERALEYDVEVVLNATAAQDGQWNLIFDGTEGTCEGEVVIKAQAEPAPEAGEPEPPAEEEPPVDEGR